MFSGWIVNILKQSSMSDFDGNLQDVLPNTNMTCEISSSHGGEYDVQSCLLGYTAV
jgi:hypothetical protein